MLVHRRVTPSIKFAGTHLYTWVKRGTVRVKCLAQEHNTMSPAMARIRTTRSGDERTNHEAPAPPSYLIPYHNFSIFLRKWNVNQREILVTSLPQSIVHYISVFILDSLQHSRTSFSFQIIEERRTFSGQAHCKCALFLAKKNVRSYFNSK